MVITTRKVVGEKTLTPHPDPLPQGEREDFVISHKWRGDLGEIKFFYLWIWV